MKHRRIVVMIVLPAVLSLAALALAEEPAPLKDKKERNSYSIGVDIGNTMKRQPFEVDPELLAAGFRDAYTGGKMRMADNEVRATLVELQKELQAKQQEQMKHAQEQMKAAAEKNKKEGEAFLAENAKKEGVKTLPSGLQYKVLASGSGPSPKATDTVETNYRGTLIDGTEFDSSYKRGQPATFPVSGVIAGWSEALQLMKVGDKWELFVPPNLAYGERGAGRDIGPNATLIFEIELLGIK
ncbi:MAG: FKBP-type peptidyl-prolyl cis-trans isomerase [Gemmatimonadota bacterium]